MPTFSPPTALASESVRQGHGDVVDSIVDSCIDFVSSSDVEISKWMERHGGWEQFRRKFATCDDSAGDASGHGGDVRQMVMQFDHDYLLRAYNIVFTWLAIAAVLCSLVFCCIRLMR